ncbi:NAD(+)--arginine ADP-ribosyltransferase EFV [compost metagenome]
MSKFTRQHSEFLRRQKVYENKYKKQFYAYLQTVNNSAATAYANGSQDYNIHHNKLQAIYERLYKDVTITEAEIQWYQFNDTEVKQQKDLIDVFAGIFAPNNNDVPITLWRSLLNEFLTVRIAGRIAEVEQTTRKRIASLIEKGIAEGLGAREVAKSIREDTQFNRNRSLTIARTETVTSANQGRYMSALSSPYVKKKAWLPFADKRTRPTHLAMLDVPFVDMDQLFFLQNLKTGALESARYPCDSSLSAGNVCNCRCLIVFVNKKDENGKLIRKTQRN